ncbi:MAG: phosphoribosyltransferase family protein [bacterium]
MAGAWLCAGCEGKYLVGAVPEVLPSEVLPAVVCLLDFGAGPVRELIHSLKYDGIREAAGVLVGLAGKCVSLDEARGYYGPEAILVPVPTSKAKLKMRGYNQAQLLAEEIAAWLGVEVKEGLVAHKRKQSQVGKGLAERSHLEGRFSVVKDGLPKDRPLVLVDDVYTTGSTLRACAEALKRDGYRVAGGLVLAHKR